MILTQIEAKEACDWLRAAGFPQYVQLYEDARFPIDISSVTQDHDFLDRDAIEALSRRLNTLNKCALMRLEISPQRKRSDDSDEDEPCAISGRWTFQRDSRRWSRLDELDVFSLPGDAGPPASGRPAGGADSALAELSEQPEVGSLHSAGSQGAEPPSPRPAATRTSSVATCSSGTSAANEDSLSEGPPAPSASRRSRGRPGRAPAPGPRASCGGWRASACWAGPGRKRRAGTSKLEISGPVLREGPDEEKLRRLNCVDVSALNGRGRSVSHPCPARPAGSTGSSSGGSSQSDASGGSAVSTPSPVARARSHSARGGGKRGGMYLEGFDPFSQLQLPGGDEGAEPRDLHNLQEASHAEEEEEEEEQEEEEEEDEDGVVFFLIPEGHKPGTFPKALSNGLWRRRDSGGDGPAPRLRRGSAPRLRRGSAGSLDSRLSFYDNVPPSPEGEELEGEWAGPPGEEGDSDSALDSASPCPSSPLQGRPGEAENGSDLDSTGNPLSEQEEGPAARERRDSGVGTSLTRSNSRPQKLRWPSFQAAHRPGRSSSPLQVGRQSVVQMNLLQKLSLLTLTALLERHAPTSKHGFSWAVPKFMKRIKVRDYKDRNVFGVPLQVNMQRTGQPLPLSIQQAMRYLRNQCLDQVGLFRKSGVKSRIQALRQMNEAGAEGGVSYEGQSAYDVADMLKQYFRDLPEPLLTSKLSDTFLQIYLYVPKEQRLQAARAAVLLLPDENREALQTLLCFLSDVAASVAENQMTCTNLAVCLAPSLFHLNTMKRDGSSPRVMQRKQSLGKPDQRDLQENLAATQGLAHMITECKKLFQIPEDMSRCRSSYMDQGLHPPRIEALSEAGYLREELDALLREAKDKFRGYDSCSTPEQAELAYKKVHDDFPLRLWKVSVEVPASPEEVLTRVLREQHRWDEDLLEARVVETLDPRTEVYRYLQNSMAPHPPRDHVVLRTWATELPKGACAVVSASVEHEGAPPPTGGLRANVLTSRYFIEPCGSGKSRLTHLCRVDCRGRFPEWYNKVFGHLCAAQVVRIRDSFTCQLDK
ncbi:hypothetical protein MATL_G00221860 [Megalops atlanticus]|uniref:Rho GTPase-activating protein 7 n=1 Tax=Megalops atlanticus TaxID=7932 RepID=A0A9D3PIE1_MEGAT|nr:hypothetical protein MATL_G00221860 [Megalops atlanticus]